MNFNWESLDGAATALNRLRIAAFEWGAPGSVDEGYMDRFAEHVNDDLNMPRVLALAWELAKSDLPPSTKKATLLEFDKIMGLRLAEWQPEEQVVPDGDPGAGASSASKRAKKSAGRMPTRCGIRSRRRDTRLKIRRKARKSKAEG